MIKINDIDSYYGGKGSPGTYQSIINHIRPHKKLIIPFLGNCAVTRAIKKPAEGIIGIDRDINVINKWKNMNFSWITLLCEDGISYLKKLSRRNLSDTVIYCDPPYIMSTRSSYRNQYMHELDDSEYIQLLKIIKKLNCDVLISTYQNALYFCHLKDWNRITFNSTTRNGSREEVLYMNYTNEDGILHDYRFLGDSFRERERIQRKINRWVSRLQRLPAKERNAILISLKKI